MSMTRLFFPHSNEVIDQISELYLFVWPTTAAIWNLRRQVKEFVDEIGEENTNNDDLLKRFASGSGISSTNLMRACLVKSWDDQQEQFARFLLINLCAIYEGWIDKMQDTFGFNGHIGKKLQFPTKYDASQRPTNGVLYALQQISLNQSDLMRNAFYSSLSMHRKNSYMFLDNLMIVYRFFKECRNCIAHAGSIADQKAVDSYKAFLLVANTNDLPVTEAPQAFPIKSESEVKLSLRGVVGFGEIILRIVTSLDVELAPTREAKKELLKSLKEWRKTKGKRSHSLKKDPAERKQQIIRLVRGIGYPDPNRTDELERILVQEGVLDENY
jgi:hypothetical protein